MQDPEAVVWSLLPVPSAAFPSMTLCTHGLFSSVTEKTGNCPLYTHVCISTYSWQCRIDNRLYFRDIAGVAWRREECLDDRGFPLCCEPVFL